MQRTLLVAMAAALLAMAARPVEAHAAPPAPEYFKRQLHDCNDDWGLHSSAYDGHDLIALDMTERYSGASGDDVVVLRFSMSAGFSSQNSQGGPLRELITFHSPSRAIKTQIETANNQAFTATSGGDFVVPLSLGAPQPILKGDGTQDGSRFTLELAYRYDQLGADLGDRVSGFAVQGYAKDKKADYMAGGVWDATTGVYVPNCPLNGTAEEAYFVSAGYTVEGSALKFFTVAADTSTLVAPPNTNSTKEFSIANKLKKTNQTVAIAVTLPAGWSVHVDPTDSLRLPADATTALRIHFLSGPSPQPGTAVVKFTSVEGGFQQTAIPMQVNVPTTTAAPTTTAGEGRTSPGESTTTAGDKVPAIETTLFLAVLVGLVALRRR